MSQEQIVANAEERELKNFIIGKLWTTSQDGKRSGSIRINRNLPKDIILKAGTSLLLHKNVKREGKQDADFSVSVLLPTATADALIALSQQNNVVAADVA